MKYRTWMVAVAVGSGACIVAMACGGSSSTTAAPADEGGSDVTTPTGDGGGNVPETGPSSYVTAPAGVGKEYCDKSYGAIDAMLESWSCCTAADRSSFQFVFVDALIKIATQHCDAELEASISKGRIQYDPSLLSACESQIQTALSGIGCGDTVAVGGSTSLKSGPCSTAFVGTVAEGQACAAPFECAAGLTCEGYATPLNAAQVGVEGTCIKPPAIGEACGQARLESGGTTTINYPFGPQNACVPGAYCTAASGGKCAQLLTQGQMCTDAKECASGLTCYVGKCDTGGPSDASGPCAANSDCKTGLYCAFAAGQGTCQPKKAASAPCANALSSECKGRCEVPDGGASSDAGVDAGEKGTCVSFCGSG